MMFTPTQDGTRNETNNMSQTNQFSPLRQPVVKIYKSGGSKQSPNQELIHKELCKIQQKKTNLNGTDEEY